MAFAFISFNHTNKRYASQLATAMEERGLPVFLTEHLDPGAHWPSITEKKLDDCATFVLIMSLAAKTSKWVQNELLHALRLNKPIRPVLLDGDPTWLAIESLQVFDLGAVADPSGLGPLPKEDFFARVAEDLRVELKSAQPIENRSSVERALFDATVEQVLNAVTEAHQTLPHRGIYVVDYSRGARAHVYRSENGFFEPFLNVEIRLERGDPRIAGFRRSLDESGLIAGQKDWFLSDVGDMTVNGVLQTGHVSLTRSVRLEHPENGEEVGGQPSDGTSMQRPDRTGSSYRLAARDLVVFFEQAMESRLSRIAIEREEPTGRWPKRY